ncbi:hypothetical protein TTHERM_00355190 (macronuclear) [Tetrahymena thermophila SB210]|uniref:TLDc domain-containing protein n=1 Tax=Tetrahymena thermophila (strain SB210) TaxID=312017 RepID=Q22Y52_TETTS|nr:hypothetical protein TTHERM_00355190 [Tetrahymena thermophila SB210]EAR90172.4 hypothetical protein TTHERM_00355190 [Tetrahymena thermophila SB210]|eukprot:XP_001010417.4 hypothetical protein TTHERM_00355190 [Tetrahymena thermophila SB210]
MGNDNCCAIRKRESNFDKSQKNYINMLFTTISENNENTKKKGIIDPQGFADYMYETDLIQKILTDELFGNDQFISYERFCNFCADLIFSEPGYKMYYLESLVEWKIKLINPKIRGDQWKQTRTTLTQLQQFMKEIFKIIETTDSAKSSYNIPDPNLILTVMFKEGLEETKSWDEIINYFYKKYPLIDDILRNYYEYKFLRKPMQYGFPVLQIKQTMAFDYNISSAIALTSDHLFRKITILNRIFSSGELSFNYETFQQQIESFEGGLLILLKFLGKEIPGTHHQQLVGVYVPDGFSSAVNQGGVYGSQEIILFEISPHFQPIYSIESILKRKERSRLQQSDQQKQEPLKRYISYTDKGLGFGYDQKTQKHRIWIDRNMFQSSYILSKDDYFESGFDYFQNHILIHIEAWSVTKDFPRHSQNIIELAENNYRQFIKYKNYQQIFSTENDASSAAHSYKFQNDVLSYSQIRNTNYLDSNGGSYINHAPQQQLMRGSMQLDEEERKKRTRQLLGSVVHRNQNGQRQTISHQNNQNSQNKDRLDEIYKKYKDLQNQIEFNQSDYDRVMDRHLQKIKSSNDQQVIQQPQQQQQPQQSTYIYTIQPSQGSQIQISQSQFHARSNSNGSNYQNGLNNSPSRQLNYSQNNVVVNDVNESFYNKHLFQS